MSVGASARPKLSSSRAPRQRSADLSSAPGGIPRYFNPSGCRIPITPVRSDHPSRRGCARIQRAAFQDTRPAAARDSRAETQEPRRCLPAMNNARSSCIAAGSRDRRIRPLARIPSTRASRPRIPFRVGIARAGPSAEGCVGRRIGVYIVSVSATSGSACAMRTVTSRGWPGVIEQRPARIGHRRALLRVPLRIATDGQRVEDARVARSSRHVRSGS